MQGWWFKSIMFASVVPALLSGDADAELTVEQQQRLWNALDHAQSEQWVRVEFHDGTRLKGELLSRDIEALLIRLPSENRTMSGDEVAVLSYKQRGFWVGAIVGGAAAAIVAIVPAFMVVVVGGGAVPHWQLVYAYDGAPSTHQNGKEIPRFRPTGTTSSSPATARSIG